MSRTRIALLVACGAIAALVAAPAASADVFVQADTNLDNDCQDENETVSISAPGPTMGWACAPISF